MVYYCCTGLQINKTRYVKYWATELVGDPILHITLSILKKILKNESNSKVKAVSVTLNMERKKGVKKVSNSECSSSTKQLLCSLNKKFCKQFCLIIWNNYFNFVYNNYNYVTQCLTSGIALRNAKFYKMLTNLQHNLVNM